MTDEMRAVIAHRPLASLLAFDPDARQFEPPLAIGLVADTHLRRDGSRDLPAEVPEVLERLGTQLILHAGDANDRCVLECLAQVAPVIAVAGNNDNPELQECLLQRESIAVGTHQIGMIHGHGGRSARDVAFSAFDNRFSVVVYGHSHIPMIEQRQGMVFINPGSPTDRRSAPHFGIGYLRVTESAIEPELMLYQRSSELVSIS